MSLLVRERPPLRLSVNIATPSGTTARWGADDPRPQYRPQNLTFDTAIPGGFASMSCVLQRDPRRAWADLEELAGVTVYGPGGEVAWQGRLEQMPDTGGGQAQVTPTCAGWQNHLKDDANAREIFLDSAFSSWQGASIQRQIFLAQGGNDETDAVVSPDQSTGEPALVTQLTGAWARQAVAEGWYDAKGVALGNIYWAWKLQDASGTIGDTTYADTRWDWAALLSPNDLGTGTDSTGNQRSIGPGTGSLAATLTDRVFAFVELLYPVAGGTSGVNYPVYWTYLGVVGNHGCPIQGTLTQAGGLGILASDAIAYALGKWAPKLAFTTGAGGTIQPSSFSIPHLAFKDPTTVADMIAQIVQYELLDWAVWDGPTFYLNPFGASSKTRYWRAMVGPAQLQETGPNVSRLLNGVVVAYTDVTGVARSVGPPGSGATVESSLLLDSDPSNPANEAGINRWGRLQMGTTTSDAAIQVGQLYLQAQAQLDTSGQASLVGHMQDKYGVWWPAWRVRAGDYISFTDASDSSYRRITATSYDDSTKTNAIQLDQPPQTMQALLARISEVVSPLGLA